jgi:hypothetical protein
MTSTKTLLVGIFLLLSGVALISTATYFAILRIIGQGTAAMLAYGAVAFFAVGFIVGLVGLFRR